MNQTIIYFDVLNLFIAAAYMAGLTVYIYLKNKESLNNVSFAIITGLLAPWSLGTALHMLEPYGLISLRLTHMFGALAVTMVFYFSMVYPQGKDVALKFKLPIFLLGGFYAWLAITGDLLVKDYIRLDPANPYAWQLVGGVFHNSFLISSVGMLVGSLGLIIYKLSKATGEKKNQLFFVLLAISIGGISIEFFSLLLPRLGIVMLDSLGPLALIFSATLVAYSIVRYKLFGLTPTVAATEILQALSSSVIVSDLEGKVLYRFGVKAQLPPEELGKIIDLTAEHGQVRGYRTTLDQKPIDVSADFFGEGGGIVIVMHDLTEIEQNYEQENRGHDELAASLAKEHKLRDLLMAISSQSQAAEIDLIFDRAKQELRGDEQAIHSLEHVASLAKKRIELLAQLQQDKQALEAKLKQIEASQQQGMARELEMARLKEELKKFKGQ